MNKIKWFLLTALFLGGPLYAVTTLMGTGSESAVASNSVQDLNPPPRGNAINTVDHHAIHALNEIRWPGENLRGEDAVAGQRAATDSLLAVVASSDNINFADNNFNPASPVANWATQNPSGGDQTTPRTLVLSWLFNDDLNRLRSGAPLQASGGSPNAAGASPAQSAGGGDLNTPDDSWPLADNPGAPAGEDKGNNSFDDLPIVNSSPAPVPEPSTFALLGIGLLGAGIFRERMKK